MAQQNPNFGSYVLFAPEYTDQEPLTTNFQVDSLQEQPIIRILTGQKDVQGRIAYDCELAELFKKRGFENVRLDTLPSDHMSIIPDGAAVALPQLYDAYWNLQKIDETESSPATATPVWADFQRYNNQNLMRYKQPFSVNANNVSYLMSRAINRRDSVSLNKLADYYISATTVPFRDIYTLSLMADLLSKINRYEVAADYYERYLKLSQEQGMEHETWYARQSYALKVLADHFHDFDRAWAILEEGKRIFTDDSLAFCYYQGVLSANHKYRLSEGADLLKKALSNESILKDNFIAPDHAFYLLAKIKFAQEQPREALKFIKEAVKRSPDNAEYKAFINSF